MEDKAGKDMADVSSERLDVHSTRVNWAKVSEMAVTALASLEGYKRSPDNMPATIRVYWLHVLLNQDIMQHSPLMLEADGQK